MADWQDVMRERSTADGAVSVMDTYGGSIEDGGTSDPSLAVLLAATAICAELRALGTVLSYHARGD